MVAVTASLVDMVDADGVHDAPRGKRGVFIALEGGEGCGKSTQALQLAQWLRDCGLSVVLTREPGGTPVAEAIRTVVLSADDDGLDGRVEALLFAAARGDHVKRVIRPALDRGDWVITDRYIDSSIAYQGYARGLDRAYVAELSAWVTDGLRPDLTIVLDLDPTTSHQRLAEKDRLESEAIDFHHAVREGFLDLAAQDPQTYLVVDASLSVDTISAAIKERVAGLLVLVGVE